PGGVFIAAPKIAARLSSALHPLERLWQTDGAAAALREIEHRLPDADQDFLLAALRLLERKLDPLGIPTVFRCLTHTSASVREHAKQAVKALGWEKTAATIEELARRADEERVGIVLEGLAAFEAHPS